MNRWRQRLRGTRVTLGQLALVSMVSAVVSAVIVVGALGETGPEKAVVAALQARQVIHEAASAPAGSGAQSSAVPAADITSASAPVTPAATVSASDDGSGSSASEATDSGSAPAGSDTSDASDSSDGSSDGSDSGGSDSSDSSGSSDSSSSASSGPAANKPTGAAAKVKHVFVVVVSTPSYAAAFGKGSVATYLNGTLRSKGVLLSGYHSLGSAQLPDYLAMVSGQAPNRDTEKGCSTYADFPGGASPTKDGLVPGTGCVYPNTALTVGDQLDGANLAWRGYIDGMTSACQHPNSGAADPTAPGTETAAGGTPTTAATTTTVTATTTTSTTSTTSTTAAGTPATGAAGYATDENPFVYFHSLLDLGDCQSDDLPLTKLATALHSASSSPRYAFIAADPCDDGTASTCPVGKPTGLAATDAFLRQVVPGILGSPAYRAGGAVVIAFTSAGGASGGNHPVRTGALVLSPHSKPGTTVATAYDPYSVLRTVEDVFGLTSLAKAKSAHGFDQAVFTR
jgi:phosphatidylinositol-3-phosphatase